MTAGITLMVVLVPFSLYIILAGIDSIITSGREKDDDWWN